MPILTLTQAKTLLQISGNTYDTLISMLIPIVEENIVNYCNNHFIDTYTSIGKITPTVYTYGNDISFLSSDNSINSTTTDFENAKFKANDVIRIYNSIHNDRMFTISSVATNKMVIDSLYTVNDEDSSNTIVIGRVKFPENLKIISSQMIKFNLQKNGVIFKSEKIDDYSCTRDNKMINGYPESIVSGLNDYRSMILKTIPFNVLYERNE